MYPLLTVVSIVVCAGASTLSPICQKGEFVKNNVCVPCTLCPTNTYIERMCGGTEDTVCARFLVKNGQLLGQELELIMKRNVTKEREDKEREDNMFKENATECFLKARKEDILIKGLMVALVMVTLTFIGYVLVTKCCGRSPKEEGSCDALIQTNTIVQMDEACYVPENRYAEANFVIGPDGTKVTEEQYVRNPMRALTSKGRSQVLVSSSRNGLSTDHRGFDGSAHVETISLSSVSETSVTLDV